MEPAAHRIRRLHWQVSAGSPGQAFAVRKTLREDLHAAVLPGLERAFDRVAPADEAVRIPRLEVTIRVRGLDDAGELVSELERRLAECLAAASRDAAPGAPARQNAVDVLVRYLDTGTVPWPLAQSDRASLVALLADTARREWSNLLGRAPESRDQPSRAVAFFFRLLQLLPEDEWASVARHLAEHGHRGDSRASQEVMNGLSGAAADSLSRHDRQQAAAVLLARAQAGPGVRDAASPPASLPDRLGGTDPGAPAFGRARPGDHEAADERFGLVVHHAGLVLLHPFLSRLFDATGILPRDQRALSRAALPRAAAVLYLAATGQEEAYEFELGFIKVLLGLHPDAPLAVGAELLGDVDRREVETLLRSVIGHWTVLKNTSIETVRASFLQRPGLLREQENHWHLQVELRAFDMLLDALPWGIGTATLPWASKPIVTDWAIR